MTSLPRLTEMTGMRLSLKDGHYLSVVTEPKSFSLYGSSKLVYGDVFSLSGFLLPDEWAV